MCSLSIGTNISGGYIMQIRKLLVTGVVIAALFGSFQIAAAADEGTNFNAFIGIRENLLLNVGKRVALRIGGGVVMEGTIGKVGDRAVELSKLAGKEYYDAIVLIDKIEAIVFKNK